MFSLAATDGPSDDAAVCVSIHKHVASTAGYTPPQIPPASIYMHSTQATFPITTTTFPAVRNRCLAHNSSSYFSGHTIDNHRSRGSILNKLARYPPRRCSLECIHTHAPSEQTKYAHSKVRAVHVYAVYSRSVKTKVRAVAKIAANLRRYQATRHSTHKTRHAHGHGRLRTNRQF